MSPVSLVPTERQIALFRTMEDIHDLTSALVVLLVDEHGTSLAGRPVIAPRMLGSSEWLGSFVLIGSMHASEIESSLLQLGLRRHDDYMRVDLDLVGIPTR